MQQQQTTMSSGSSGGSPPLRRKIVVLGFRGIGKTAVTTHFVEGRFTEKYDPTIEGNYEHRVKISNAVFDVQIIDTAGMVRAAQRVRGISRALTQKAPTPKNRFRDHAGPGHAAERRTPPATAGVRFRGWAH